MDFYSIWPSWACVFLLLLIVRIPLFSAADAPPSPTPSRRITLDGLRGFLALAVFFHHSAIYHRYLLDGHWNGPPSVYYSLLGQVGVAFFFMITGYLFWGRLIAQRGRPNWLHLYIGRLFRIAPLYLTAILVMFGIVLTRTGWHLNVAPSEFLSEIGVWLTLGLMGGGDINGNPATILLLAGVTWTLRYEWIFYLGLPVLAVAARNRNLALPATAVIMAAGLYWFSRGAPYVFTPVDSAVAPLFGVGMCSAALHSRNWRVPFNDMLASGAVVALLLLLFLGGVGPYESLLLMGLCFHLIASGCTVFGLLTCRSAQRLGSVSYGIYLLQGLVLVAVLQPQPARLFALGSPLHHWMMVMAASVVLVGVATLTHAWVERPGITLGKRVASLWPSVRPGRVLMTSPN